MNRVEYILFGVAYKLLQHRNLKQDDNERNLSALSNDDIGRIIALFGCFESEILDTLKRDIFPKLKEGTCLDVGANIGNHSIVFSKFFKKVIAFEPNKFSYDLLKLNTRDIKNVEIVEEALSDTVSKKLFHTETNNSGKSKIVEEDRADRICQEVSTNRLDDFNRQRNEPIVFMKLDVEGHESNVLDGAKLTISKHQPTVMMEVLNEEIINGECNSLNILIDLGYKDFWSIEIFSGWKAAALSLAKQVKIYLPLLSLMILIFGVPKGCLVKINPKNLKSKNYDAIIAKF